MRSNYGKRGGTSANAGRKAVKYTATLPDGREVTKSSYYVDQPVAVLGCYQHEEQWHALVLRPRYKIGEHKSLLKPA